MNPYRLETEMSKNPGRTLFTTIMWVALIPIGILSMLLLFVYAVTALFT